MTTGYTEFVPIGLKAVFTNVDLEAQQITIDILQQGNLIVTLRIDLRLNTMKKVGSFDAISHLQDYGIDEHFIISRVKEELNSIVENNNSKPNDFWI